MKKGKKRKEDQPQVIMKLMVGDVVVLDESDIALVTSRPGEEVEAREEPAPIISCQAVAPRLRRGPLRLVSLATALHKAGIRNLN